MRQQITKYGTNNIGKPFLSNEGTWFRRDSYKPNDEREAMLERHFALGRNDYSDLFIDGTNGKYHGSCECCYLNFSHTLALHEARVARTNPSTIESQAMAAHQRMQSAASQTDSSAYWEAKAQWEDLHNRVELYHPGPMARD